MTDEIPNPTTPDPEQGPPVPDPEPNPTTPDPAPPRPGRAVSSAETRPRRPDYRGEELDPERGPGLGCFWFQVIVLGFFIVLIPIGLQLNWPFELLAFLLFVVIGLLLLTGQSVIFLLRLVAADRRSQGRRRPLASSTKTVGEIEDAMDPAAAAQPADAEAAVAVAQPAALEPAVHEPAPEPAVADQVVDSGSAIRAQEPSEPTADATFGPRGAATADDPVEGDGGPVAADAAGAAAPPAAEPAATEPTAEPAAVSDPARPEEPDPGVRQ